jgi:hypothetical protein
MKSLSLAPAPNTALVLAMSAPHKRKCYELYSEIN